MESQEKTASPRWTNTTKLIVGLSFVAILALLVIQFRSLIGPLILAFILSYLFYPLANWLKNKVKISWSIAVSLIYLTILLIILGLLTWGGFTFVEQIQSLVKFIDRSLEQLPGFLEKVSQWSFSLGPIKLDFPSFDLTKLAEQLLGFVEPLLSRAGTLVGTLATGALSILGMILFVFLISYFVLVESRGTWARVLNLKIPGYQEDFHRLGKELSRIWNAFLRGQLILMVITMLIYAALLSILGIRYAIILAFLAGLARFIPYVGPWITWITYFLVALLQGQTIFGLESFVYAIIVVVIALLTDTFMDNILVPRIYANTLRVHPAAVLVAILVAAAWLGLVGVFLAAPVLATFKLLLGYIIQKMFDRDPWENLPAGGTPAPIAINSFFGRAFRQLASRVSGLFNRRK